MQYLSCLFAESEPSLCAKTRGDRDHDDTSRDLIRIIVHMRPPFKSFQGKLSPMIKE